MRHHRVCWAIFCLLDRGEPRKLGARERPRRLSNAADENYAPTCGCESVADYDDRAKLGLFTDSGSTWSSDHRRDRQGNAEIPQNLRLVDEKVTTKGQDRPFDILLFEVTGDEA